MTYNKQQHSNLTKLYVNMTEIILMLCVPCTVQKLIYKPNFMCTKTCTHTSVSLLMFQQASTQHRVHTYNIIRTQLTFGYQDNQSLMSREDCTALTHSVHGTQRNISFSVLI